MTTLSDMPAEILSTIGRLSDRDDLPAMRLSCRLLHDNIQDSFCTEHFEHRSHNMTLHSLRALVEISKHVAFQKCIRSFSLSGSGYRKTSMNTVLSHLSTAIKNMASLQPRRSYTVGIFNGNRTGRQSNKTFAFRCLVDACIEHNLSVHALRLDLDSDWYRGRLIDNWDNAFDKIFCRLATQPNGRLRKDLDVLIRRVRKDQPDSIIHLDHRRKMLFIERADDCKGTSTSVTEFTGFEYEFLPTLDGSYGLLSLHMKNSTYDVPNFVALIGRYASTLQELHLEDTVFALDDTQDESDIPGEVSKVLLAIVSAGLSTCLLGRIGISGRNGDEYMFEGSIKIIDDDRGSTVEKVLEWREKFTAGEDILMASPAGGVVI